ncbi:DUF1716-domain-containing protein [Eremomyces bilateralis CBS 781.70]|uniref:DUF1716-domain-containing protein n=1 Tax=Eremomyces bilateralis CBS 781.70 TaxID=1392243 RepID=A0A6G1FSI6_9PEZI|nr:DUF1716-domain-containing protein [Eremomyces bilateralis CBS 781.70]KAF1808649.1 DUF1716-domain-containing protein [Eremomyces bilateralis CBS 781.70]
MTSIDELFKGAGIGSKRKIELNHDPSHFYKSAKLSANGDAKGKTHASVEEADENNYDDDAEAGPEMPPDDGEDPDEEGRFFGGGMDKATAAAMDYLDIADGQEEYVQEKYDSAWIRRLALNFEKKISKNAELRAKYEEDPTKFLQSEADLDDEVRNLSILAEHTDLYPEFAKLGCVASLVSLLAHENTDIAIRAIQTIGELLDEDVEAEPEQWDALVDAALEADIISLLTANFSRFDESATEEDRNGVYHSLSAVEILSSRSSVAAELSSTGPTSLLPWLLSRLQRTEKAVSQNKQYAAEILSILLSSSPSTRSSLASVSPNGIDTLLNCLAMYRKSDPSPGSTASEYFEDLFDALVLALLTPANKAAFQAAEGIELLLIMLRSSSLSKPRALRTLDHGLAGSSPESGALAEHFVEAQGLGILFKLFMKKQDASTTEHLLGILSALLRLLPADSAGRIRTLAKFVERDYEKIGRLGVVRRELEARLRGVDAAITEEKTNLKRRGDEGEIEVREEEWLARRLESGLHSLRLVDAILAWLVAEDAGAKRKIMSVLDETDQALSNAKAVLQEQLKEIGTPDEAEEVATAEMLSALVSFLN